MSDGKMTKSRKVAICGLLTALCFALSYIEFLLPFTALGVPGIKLGLANLCVVAGLYLFGPLEAAGINLVRMVLNWLFFGSFTGFLFSIAGGTLSLLAMIICKKTGLFSPVGVSALGGASHNIGQAAVAVFLTDAGAIWYYVPILIAAGTLAGVLNGIIIKYILARLQRGKGQKNE